MFRYLFEYEVLSTGTKREFSIAEKDEETAKTKIKERVADIEFTDESDVKIGRLLKSFELKDSYYVCDGCQ